MSIQKTAVRTAVKVAAAITLIGIVCAHAYYSRSNQGGTRQLALIFPSEIVAAERICRGVFEAHKKGPFAEKMVIRPYSIDVYQKMRTMATVETVIEQRPDVIVSVGGAATIAVHETMKKRGAQIPVVFLGVNAGVRWGLIESPQRPGGLMTGIDAEGFDPSIPAKLIYAVKPSTKKVLIPYILPKDPRDDRVAGMVLAIKQKLESFGVSTTLVEFNGVENVMEKLSVTLPGHDLLFVPELGSLNYHYVGFSKLCSEMGITFFCGLVEGVTLEAAISYGIDPKPIGWYAYNMATDIVFRKKDPATTPVRVLDDMRELYINLTASAHQGYAPNLAQLVHALSADPDLAGITQRVHISRTLSEEEQPLAGQGSTV